MSYFRRNIQRMTGYVPGEQPQEKGFIKLNTNESPYPPSRKVLRAVRAAVNADLRLYPDPMANALRRKAAELFGTRPECVLAGNGSDELLTIVVRAFAGPKRVVAYPTPTYSLYPTLAAIEDARTRPVAVPARFLAARRAFPQGRGGDDRGEPEQPDRHGGAAEGARAAGARGQRRAGD